MFEFENPNKALPSFIRFERPVSRVRRLDYEIIKDYEVINRRHVYCEQVKIASSVPPFKLRVLLIGSFLISDCVLAGSVVDFFAQLISLKSK
jgi:hypothetical protein